MKAELYLQEKRGYTWRVKLLYIPIDDNVDPSFQLKVCTKGGVICAHWVYAIVGNVSQQFFKNYESEE